MADRGYDRRGRGRNRAHHALIRKGEQVLKRAAAAGNDDYVAEAPAVGGAHRAGDARRGVRALHRRGHDHHVHAGVAAPQHAQQIAHRGAGGGGDHGHPPRQQRQRLLAGGVEQAGGGQGALALLQYRQQIALAGALDRLRDELIAAARAVDRHRPAYPHQHAVAGDEGEQVVAILEQRHAQARVPVNQVEVVVAGAGGPEAADLALHHHVAELPLQQPPNSARELGNGERAPRTVVRGGARPLRP